MCLDGRSSKDSKRTLVRIGTSAGRSTASLSMQSSVAYHTALGGVCVNGNL